MAVVNSPKPPPKFTLLTSGGLDGRRVATLMHARGIPFELVLIAHPRRKRRGQPFIQFMPTWIRDHLAGIHFLRLIRQRNLPSYPIKGRFYGRINSKRLVRHLTKSAPDYIIMMGGGILKAETIRTARQGVLNVHPALLPWVRGVGVVLHSILNEIPLGVTAHFIDEGIDTGAIIARYRLPVAPEDKFKTIKLRSQQLCCATMFKLITDHWDGKEIQPIAQNKRYDLFRADSKENEQAALKMVADGAAARLYKSNFRGELESIEDGAELLAQYDGWWRGLHQF